MQMHQIRLIFLENDFIEQSCLMYLEKQVPFVNSNMRLLVNTTSKLGLCFQVTELQLLMFPCVIFFKVSKAAVRGQTNL